MINGIALASNGATAASGNEDFGFTINGYLKYQLFGQDLYITTTHISLIIVMITIIIFAILANRAIKKADPNKVPGTFLNIVEFLVETVDNLIVSNMGAKNGPKFANYVGTVLVFIFISNTCGIFQLRPPTADYGVTLALGLITFVLIQFNAFKYKKMGHIKGLFEPVFLMFPANLISEFATPLSLSLRLFGNVLSGTVLMGLIYGLLPNILLLVWPSVLHVYFDLFSGAIQTFVFGMLTMVFISQQWEDA